MIIDISNLLPACQSEWTNADGSYRMFILFSFASSLYSVLYNVMTLTHWMFDNEIRSFFELLERMRSSNLGRAESSIQQVFKYFDIPAVILLLSRVHLHQITQLHPSRLTHVKQIYVNLPRIVRNS